MRFLVRAVDSDHQLHTLYIDDVDRSAVSARVKEQGLHLLHIEVDSTTSSILSRRTSAKSSVFLDTFNTELLTLLSAGLSLLESLEVMSERESDVDRLSIYQHLRTDIQNGHRLSVAFSRQPMIFTPLYVGLVRSAEETSELAHAFQQFSEYSQRRNVLRQRIISALIYPAILFIVGGAVILFLMLYVVPRFSEVYKDTGRPLPLLSNLLLSWGQLLHAHSRAALLIIFGTLTISVLYLQTHGASFLFRFMKLLPKLRRQLNAMEYSRIYLTLSMLIRGGIPVAEALTMMSDTVSPETHLQLQRIKSDIEQGRSLSYAFESAHLADLVSLRLLRVGEKSGQLAAMLFEAGKLQENEVSRWIEKFSKTFEPILMTIIGLVVGGIVILLYMPIFDLAGSIQ